mmetsp:Transcript_44658/g.87477  ORF Transcript_44658/g.87477 Transcript_44658/m.87477 type:complete len:927 (+) Transcript_44658:222-3002(+)
MPFRPPTLRSELSIDPSATASSSTPTSPVDRPTTAPAKTSSTATGSSSTADNPSTTTTTTTATTATVSTTVGSPKSVVAAALGSLSKLGADTNVIKVKPAERSVKVEVVDVQDLHRPTRGRITVDTRPAVLVKAVAPKVISMTILPKPSLKSLGPPMRKAPARPAGQTLTRQSSASKLPMPARAAPKRPPPSLDSSGIAPVASLRNQEALQKASSTPPAAPAAPASSSQELEAEINAIQVPNNATLTESIPPPPPDGIPSDESESESEYEESVRITTRVEHPRSHRRNMTSTANLQIIAQAPAAPAANQLPDQKEQANEVDEEEEEEEDDEEDDIVGSLPSADLEQDDADGADTISPLLAGATLSGSSSQRKSRNGLTTRRAAFNKSINKSQISKLMDLALPPLKTNTGAADSFVPPSPISQIRKQAHRRQASRLEAILSDDVETLQAVQEGSVVVRAVFQRGPNSITTSTFQVPNTLTVKDLLKKVAVKQQVQQQSCGTAQPENTHDKIQRTAGQIGTLEDWFAELCEEKDALKAKQAEQDKHMASNASKKASSSSSSSSSAGPGGGGGSGPGSSRSKLRLYVGNANVSTAMALASVRQKIEAVMVELAALKREYAQLLAAEQESGAGVLDLHNRAIEGPLGWLAHTDTLAECGLQQQQPGSPNVLPAVLVYARRYITLLITIVEGLGTPRNIEMTFDSSSSASDVVAEVARLIGVGAEASALFALQLPYPQSKWLEADVQLFDSLGFENTEAVNVVFKARYLVEKLDWVARNDAVALDVIFAQATTMMISGAYSCSQAASALLAALLLTTHIGSAQQFCAKHRQSKSKLLLYLSVASDILPAKLCSSPSVTRATTRSVMHAHAALGSSLTPAQAKLAYLNLIAFGWMKDQHGHNEANDADQEAEGGGGGGGGTPAVPDLGNPSR